MNAAARPQGLALLQPVHLFFATARTWRAAGLACLLGAFAALAFAPFHLFPALVISVTALVWMLDGARREVNWGKAAFLRGWGFAFGFFLIGMHWTAAPFLVDPARHAWFLWMPLIALPGGMGLIWGGAALLAARFWVNAPGRIFVFAIALTLAELVRGYLFGGFPWNLPGTAWAPGGAFSQAAALGGVYWLSLLTLFAAAAPAALVDRAPIHGLGGRVVPVVIACVLAGAGWGWGTSRLQQPVQLRDQMVTLMDAGVPQRLKYADTASQQLERYIDFLRDSESAPGDIVIWPEGALPFDVLGNTYVLGLFAEYLGERDLILGTTRITEQDGDTVFHNSLGVLRARNQQTELLSLYNKHRLVPFGELPAVEIVPFGEYVSAFLPPSTQQLAKSGFTPGSQPALLFPDGVPPFIALICYEGLFPEIVRRAEPDREQAEWIVLVSSDGWFGGWIGPAQHYAQNRYRAIESGLPMARVASRGVTAMVDGHGRETARGAVIAGDPADWRSSVVRTALPQRVEPTPYQRYGSTLFWTSLAIFAALAFATRRG